MNGWVEEWKVGGIEGGGWGDSLPVRFDQTIALCLNE